MTASTKAFFLLPPAPGLGGIGAVPPPSGGVLPEGAPAWLWGQGIPSAIAPFTTVNKGSLYSEVNATDDYGHVWVKVDEGGDAADYVRLLTSSMTVAQTYVSTALNAWELNYTATAIAGANMVGLNIAVTNAGTAASWISGLFVSISEPVTKSTSGYFSAAEFELNCECETSSAMAVISLGSNITAMGSDTSTSFIKCQDWGTEEMPAFLDITSIDAGSDDKTVLWSASSADVTVTHCLKILRAATPYWIMCSSAGPSA